LQLESFSLAQLMSCWVFWLQLQDFCSCWKTLRTSRARFVSTASKGSLSTETLLAVRRRFSAPCIRVRLNTSCCFGALRLRPRGHPSDDERGHCSESERWLALSQFASGQLCHGELGITNSSC